MISYISILLSFIVLYGLTIWGLSLVLGEWKVSSKIRILLSFIIFGSIVGCLVAWAWPYDIIILLSFFTVFIADKVYHLAILFLGDPNSSQAHYTIPWILRIPQLYVGVSILIWGIFGSLIQYISNRMRKNEV